MSHNVWGAFGMRHSQEDGCARESGAMDALANEHCGRKCGAVCNVNGFLIRVCSPSLHAGKFGFEVKPKELLSLKGRTSIFPLSLLSCVWGNLALEIPALSFWDLVSSLRGQHQFYWSEQFQCVCVDVSRETEISISFALPGLLELPRQPA